LSCATEFLYECWTTSTHDSSQCKTKWQEFYFLVLLLRPAPSEEQDYPDGFKTKFCPAQVLQVILVAKC
jgi:hypothetical protein